MDEKIKRKFMICMKVWDGLLIQKNPDRLWQAFANSQYMTEKK